MPLPSWPDTSPGAADESGNPAAIDPNNPDAGPLVLSNSPQNITILRYSWVVTDTGGQAATIVEVDGSPFVGALEVVEKDPKRVESSVGVSTVDVAYRLWINDTTADIRVNDVALLPEVVVHHTEVDTPTLGTIWYDWITAKGDIPARIQRIRTKAAKLECALETGAV